MADNGPGPSQSPYVSWESNPSGRGTWSILVTCVSTLVVCVYTALHQNIPPVEWETWRRYLSLSNWVFTGLVAPEVLVFAALRESLRAKELTKDAQRLQSRGILPLSKWGKWKEQHSFFVTMGGYQLCDPVVDVHKVRSSRRRDQFECRRTLSATDFLLLINLGLDADIIPITKDEIDDRNKAQSLAKILSIIQAGFLLLQVVTRLGTGLAVTELEVNTLAHAVATLTSYGFWFNKPLGINEPIILINDEEDSWVHIFDNLGQRMQKWFGEIPIDSLAAQEASEEMPLMNERTSSTTRHMAAPPNALCNGRAFSNWLELISTSFTGQHRFLLLPASAPSNIADLDSSTGRYLLKDGNYTNLIVSLPGNARAVLDNLEFKGQFLTLYEKDVTVLKACLNPQGEKRLWSRPSGKYYGFDSHKHLRATFLGPHKADDALMNLTPLTMVFAALHLAMWDAHFPTTAEQLIWRASSILVLFSGPLSFCLSLGPLLTGNAPSIIIGYYVEKPFWFVYAAARLYLVIEAFISLRSQPRSAYATPDWTKYIPHL